MLRKDPRLFRAEASLLDHTACSMRTGRRGSLWYFPNSHRQGLATGLLYGLPSSYCWVAIALFSFFDFSYIPFFVLQW